MIRFVLLVQTQVYGGWNHYTNTQELQYTDKSNKGENVSQAKGCNIPFYDNISMSADACTTW